MDLLAPSEESGASVAYTGTAGVTAAFRQRSRAVLVWVTTDAYVSVGEGVTATSADTPVPAYTPVLFSVPIETEAPWRVSAIQISAGGTVYAKPVSGSTA